ncbi:MAG: septum formation protein Maf [Bdellovibrionaceae bacterium]|nr:septum formation protein Maf [Pseudobdellovibrionaceae bacterium]
MVNKRELILASTSLFRIQQLRELEIAFRSLAPQFNEESFKSKKLPANELVKALAYEKAKSLQSSFPNSLILGADQLVSLNGEILGKAGSAEKATQQLLKLSNQSHQLLTAMCLLTPDKTFEHTDVTEIHIRKLKPDEARQYVNKHQTWNCAGSYKIECQPALIIEKINTQDPTSIVGLPTFTLVNWLHQVKFLTGFL